MSKSTIENEHGFIEALRSLDPKASNYLARVRARSLGVISHLKTAGFTKAGDDEVTRGLAPTSLRRAVSRYRNAVREQLGDEHPSLKYLKVSAADQAAYHEANSKRLVQQHHGRRPLDADRHVDTALEVLERVDREIGAGYLIAPTNAKGTTLPDYTPPLELAAALIAVTGRRPIEVLQDIRPYESSQMDFALVKTPDPSLFDKSLAVEDRYSMLFSGQRKERSAVKDPYEIPVLADPQLIVRCLRALRARYNVQGKTPDQVGDTVWKNIGKYAKGEFATQQSPGYHDRTGEPIAPKELRAAYACVAYEWYAPRRYSWNAFTARCLGHSVNDLLTSFSYDLFFPWGSARPYDDEVQDAARETLAALRADLTNEPDAHVRARIERDIASVATRVLEKA